MPPFLNSPSPHTHMHILGLRVVRKGEALSFPCDTIIVGPPPLISWRSKLGKEPGLLARRVTACFWASCQSATVFFLGSKPHRNQLDLFPSMYMYLKNFYSASQPWAFKVPVPPVKIKISYIKTLTTVLKKNPSMESCE